MKQKITVITHFIIFLAFWSLFSGFVEVSADTVANDDAEEIQNVFGEKNKVICVTIPKSGTHLLIKCLALLNIEGVSYNYNTPKIEKPEKIANRYPYYEITANEYADRAFSRLKYRIEKNKNKRNSYLVHLPFRPKYKRLFDKFTTSNFLMVRDPRDQMISLATTSLKDPVEFQAHLQEVLIDLLNKTQIHIPSESRHGACDLMWTLGIVNFYQAFLKWGEKPKFCVIKFENLIGPKGGGSIEAQIKEIRKIGAHLNVELSDQQVLHAADNLFGETRTYTTGQTQKWKQYFTPEVKAAFKNVPGACQLLIDLGYEQDCNW